MRSPGNNNTVRYCTGREIPLVIYSRYLRVPPLRYHGCGESTPVSTGHKVSDTGAAAGTFTVPVSFPLRNGIIHRGPINVAGSADRSSTLHIQENNNTHLQPHSPTETEGQKGKDRQIWTGVGSYF